MKPKKIISILSIIFLGILFLGTFLLFSTKELHCSLKEMLLEPGMIPEGWKFFYFISPPLLEKHGASEALGITFTHNSDVTHHTVYFFRNDLEALLYYAVNSLDFSSSDFTPNPRIEWTDIKDLNQRELSGDSARIKCMTGKDEFINGLCAAVIRYGPVISAFYAPTNTENMSLSEFKEAVILIDHRISSCLK